ncbi:chloride channel protein [Donghicola tyrosinivorans]|uniref:CIC family chloride channel protein n=1 Tax=Donghicola tyrosinivorans TaxID=1652492 RepID=A0A2T0X500_9RHOB|nr:CIC family chloride channel protein [Donghicola tyrosinivorans]
MKDFFKESAGLQVVQLKAAWHRLVEEGPGQAQFWLIALFVGVLSGLATVGFRFGIQYLQEALYGTDDVSHLHSFLGELPWMWVVGIPTLGGLVVGIILHRFTPDGRVRSVADVIEGAALNNGRVERRAGLASALASLITLSSGGSSGREGPVVHLAAVLSTFISARIKADGITGRNLMGCAVAAAVAASFNAPIAGALFAMEVVLRHFAIQAFAPIAVASVAGSVIARMFFGDGSEFSLASSTILAFYQELPAFFILGLVAAVVGVVLMRLIFWADNVGNRVQASTHLRPWMRPMVTGAMLGVIALWFPHIIGVGYETTARALHGDLLLHEAIVFALLKIIAVAITMAGRMGGGVFSPALMTGALTGAAFGIIATGVIPNFSGSPTLYALAGMGAVAASVLGAPISTTMIVFELTGDWQTGLAVMVAVSSATALSTRLVDRSFFLTQLMRRDIQLAAGPQAYLLKMYSVMSVMRRPDHPSAAPEEHLNELAESGTYLTAGQTLRDAMRLFDQSGADYLPVIRASSGEGAPEILGALFQLDALRTFNKALAETAREEHS